MLVDIDLAWHEARSQLHERLIGRPRRWATPGAMACELDQRMVQTPALELIDRRLVDLADDREKRLAIFMSPQEGKLVADDAPVPTPDGWVRHGDLQPGSVVFHPSGRQIKVTEVHPPALASMRVRFSDHTSVLVHPAHEWMVWDRGRGRWVTMETRQLAAVRLSHGTPGRRGHQYRFHLPLREPLDCPDADLQVDPYTLGVWLGDGSSSKPAVTHHPDDHYDIAYPQTAHCVHPGTGIVTTYYGGGMLHDLRATGVLGNKHIPAAYLRASIRQRRALLAGLIDTDGHVSASGQASFDNANPALVHSTAELIRTLGYRAHVHRPTPPKRSSSGIQGRQQMWRVTFTPHDQVSACLPRKTKPVRLGRRRCAIVDIREEAPLPGRCITVESEDGLYLVGEGMVATHNSERCSHYFPLWMLEQNPDLRIAIVSHSQDLAYNWGWLLRQDITTFNGINHDIDLGLRLHERPAQGNWRIKNHHGSVYCTGISGSLAGRPVDCLRGDTPVLTEYGYARIADLHYRCADTVRVASYNHQTGRVEWRRIVASRAIPDRPLVEVVTTSGRRITCTPDHRIYTADRGYVPVAELRPGERLVAADQGDGEVPPLRRANDQGAFVHPAAKAGDATILLPHLRLRRLEGDPDLPGLRDVVHQAAVRGAEGGAQRLYSYVLHQGMLPGGTVTGSRCGTVLRSMRQAATDRAPQEPVLLSAVPARPSNGRSHMRRMLRAVHTAAVRVREEAARWWPSVLLPGMHGPRVQGSRPPVPAMWGADGIEGPQASLLLERVPSGVQPRGQTAACMSPVRGALPAQEFAAGVLRSGVCERGPLQAHGGRGQLALQERQQLRRMVPADASADPGTRREAVPSLRGTGPDGVDRPWGRLPVEVTAGGASPQRAAAGQPPREPDHAVRPLPHDPPQVGHDTVSVVRELRGTRDVVYDLQVEGNRNFFAGQVLVHNCLIIDDPIKDLEQANSIRYRERAWRFWQAVAVPRMGPHTKVVLMTTRWHEDDLAGRLLEHEGDRAKGGKWWVISIPARCEDARSDPLGRAEGEYMVSARGRSQEDWRQREKDSGAYAWAALYQQRPTPAEGGMFKRIWWRYWTWAGQHHLHLGGRTVDLRDCWKFGTVDLAASEKTSADWTVISAWARTLAGDLLLLDRVRVRIGEEQHFAHARPLVERWGLDTLFVEKSQQGYTLVREATQSGVPVTPLQAETDKVTRALPASAWCSGGRVWLPANVWWLGEWCDECVVGSTMILTRQGLKAAKEIEVGDEVLTHLGRFRQVTAVSQRQAAELVEIRAKTLDPLVLTPDHPVYAMAVRRNRGGFAAPADKEWVPAGEVSCRTSALTARGQIEPTSKPHHAMTFPVLEPEAELREIDLRAWFDMDVPERPQRRGYGIVDDGETIRINIGRAQRLRYRQQLDHRFGRICGLYLAEGSFAKGRAYWSFHKEETHLADEVRSYLRDRWGINSHVAIASKASPNCVNVTVSLLRMGRFFETFGRGAANKRIPWWAWDAPTEFVEGLVSGWLDGDGHRNEEQRSWLGTTVSPHLAWGMRAIATRIGRWATVRSDDLRGPSMINGNMVKSQHRQYTVGFRDGGKVTHVFDGQHVGLWVKETKQLEGDVVYNFSVAEDESYVTTGGAVHNCAGFPAARHDDQVDTLSYAVRASVTQWMPHRNKADQPSQPSLRQLQGQIDGGEGGDPFGVAEVTDFEAVPL